MSSTPPKIHLPKAQFNAIQTIGINASPATTYEHLQQLNFHKAPITSRLFALRKIQIPTALTPEGVSQTGFNLIEEKPNQRITLGLIGQFWKKDGNLQQFNSENFEINHTTGFAKAVWCFNLLELPGKKTLVSLQTRIQCMDEITLKRFKNYWWIVKPISRFTRRELLLTLKNSIERS